MEGDGGMGMMMKGGRERKGGGVSRRVENKKEKTAKPSPSSGL